MGAIVNCVAYAEGRRVKAVEIDEIDEILKQPDMFIWIGLHEPDTELLEQVQEAFCLHDLAIEDAHTAHQRPKLESYEDSLFVVLRTARQNFETRQIEFGESHFFVGKNYIVSVRHGASRPYTDVRARCESTPDLLSQGPGFVLYALMDAIVDHYFPVVDALEEKLEALEEQIFGGEANRDTTERIYNLKRELLEVKRGISPLIDICNRLTRFGFDLIDGETRPYFRDVYDHVIRINEMIDTSRELLTTALEANFSLISIAQNEDSKRFAGWAAIIAVPTMIAGIYGMNFDFMPELRFAWAYPLVLLVTLAICLYLYRRFRRVGWL